MPQKVLFLGGVLGSELRRGFAWQSDNQYRKIWIDPIQLIGGGLSSLHLAGDGVSPGILAGAYQILPGIPLPQYYLPMMQTLGYAGHSVLGQGYDWRLSLPVAAAKVWGQVQAWLGAEQLYVVCHSMGGLLARALYGVMKGYGQAGQFARLICIGTPHYGSWQAVWVWWHIADLYRMIIETLEAKFPLATRPVVAWIDLVCASWPGMYELMAFAGDGPLFDDYQSQAEAIYQPATYVPPANPFISAARLAAAASVQDQLAELLPVPQMVGIYGTGWKTPVALQPGGLWHRPDQYLYTDQGDGQVTVAEGGIPQVQQILVGGQHYLLCQSTQVQQLVLSLLAQGAAPIAAGRIADISLAAGAKAA